VAFLLTTKASKVLTTSNSAGTDEVVVVEGIELSTPFSQSRIYQPRKCGN
jgi:hypothetical protein